jgi:hypothetical protein
MKDTGRVQVRPNVRAKATAEAGGLGRLADDEPRRPGGKARLP